MTSPYVQRYRSRYLPGMSLAEIEALPDKDWAPVILAMGAIEQHGPHLPVAVDAYLGEVHLTLALERLPPDVPCYVAPPITIGKSNEHTGFPGTLSVSKQTLRSQLLAVAQQIRRWGFKSLYVLHTHGGNVAVAGYTLREIESKLGIKAENLRTEGPSFVSSQEQFFGYHANEVETAFMLALVERFVRPELAVCDYAGSIDDPGELRAERTAATFSWVSQDLSQTGIMGDAPAGTKDKGQRWLQIGAQAYADAIVKICQEAKARLA